MSAVTIIDSRAAIGTALLLVAQVIGAHEDEGCEIFLNLIYK
jgi:hypothetical protein